MEVDDPEGLQRILAQSRFWYNRVRPASESGWQDTCGGMARDDIFTKTPKWGTS